MLGRALVLTGAIAAFSAGCADKRALGPPPSESTARPAPSLAASDTASAAASASAAPDGGAAKRERDWVEAIRLEQWSEAAAKIDALLSVERERPEIKYARARVALELGEHEKARDLLTGLDDALPDLADDIRRYRAEAAAVAGPHAEAAAYFARSGRPQDLARAAEAYERAGDLTTARKTAERAVTRAQKGRSRAVEGAVRAVRARLAQGGPTGPAAIADLRWIATRAPATPEGIAARETLDKLKVTLTAKEIAARIDALFDAARADDAVAELEGPAGALLPAKEKLHLYGMALYRARRHEDAAQALEKAAKSGTGREAEELHYAARAMARAERDDDAVKKHREVARRFRSTPWGDRSSFMAAQLLAQTGKYKEAVQAFTAYLGAFPRGERKDDAEYERALAQLSGDSPLAARQIFAKLGSSAKPDEAARLLELEGVAAFRGGQREIAVRLWNKVQRAAPLSWASGMARARLVQAGEALPPVMDPAPQAAGEPVEGKLPKPVALLASIGLDADAESWLLANEQSAAAPYPGHESEALCSMYSKLSRAKRRYRVGAAAVAYTTLMRTPSPSERWAWDCVYPAPYREHVRNTEQERNLPFGLVHAVMRQESAFDPVIASPAGAVGLLQIIPPTARAIAREIEPGGAGPGELSNPGTSVRYGGYYLSRLLTMFEGSVPLAAAAYNAGPKAVSHWLAGARDTDADVWVARIPYEETRTYVARVAGNLLRYQWLAGGNDKVVSIPLRLPENARAPADAY
ncbi:MAG: transglycosylase SLT domain-containing protein [Polyangiaceae bacterium]